MEIVTAPLEPQPEIAVPLALKVTVPVAPLVTVEESNIAELVGLSDEAEVSVKCGAVFESVNVAVVEVEFQFESPAFVAVIVQVPLPEAAVKILLPTPEIGQAVPSEVE